MKYILAMINLCLISLFNQPGSVLTRFTTPAGYTQQKVAPGSFAEWLENLPLKPAGTHTKTFTGAIASTDIETAAVVDISVGKQDLQQCADVVMRLRGEYLYQAKRYNEISFNFVSGFKCDYIHYANGFRYHNDHWVLTAKKDYGYPAFMRYMELVFAYAGTLSLEKELHKVTDADGLEAGEVFIHGGAPGDCFIVMDVVENTQHKKQFLLAQSFMPAQNLQVLQYDQGNCWFTMDKIANIWYGDLVSSRYLRKFD